MAVQQVPFPAKLCQPLERPGIVDRAGLRGRLASTRDTPVVLVVAPAGYGKTTVLGQWSRRSERAVAWMSVSEGDNDPTVLLAYLAASLGSIEPFAPEVLAGITRSEGDLSRARLPLLGRAVAKCSTPFLFVLDDVHLLQSPEALAVVQTVAAHVPAGSQLVIAARQDPALPWSRWVATGRVARLGAEDLTMNQTESIALLRAAGVSLEPEAERALVERADGWPAGLYLAALTLREAASDVDAARRFTGADRLVADYLRDEVMHALPADTVEFLLTTSVLERLSRSSCDALTGRSGSAETLAELARTNLFVVPLDPFGDSYRYHHLFSEMLRGELERRDPARARLLHSQASVFCESEGDLDHAIVHAHAAAEHGRTVELIWRAAPICLGDGRTATVARWLVLYAQPEIMASPALVITKAWWAWTAGLVDEVDHWLSVAERFDSDAVLPDGNRVDAAVVLLLALAGKDGLVRLRDDAARAVQLHDTESPFRVLGLFLEGVAQLLLGDRDGARSRLDECERIAGLVVPATAAQASAQLALLAADDKDGVMATRLVDRSLRVVNDHGLAERPAMALVFAAAALVHARDRSVGPARAEADQADALLANLVGVAPWARIYARVLLARAFALLGDVGSSRASAVEAERLLERYPDAGVLPEQVAEVRRRAEAVPSKHRGTRLTPAEMRVLSLLRTHLPLGQIAERLSVSRHTVKSQANAIYAKLGVTSRADAVDRALQAGIIEDP